MLSSEEKPPNRKQRRRLAREEKKKLIDSIKPEKTPETLEDCLSVIEKLKDRIVELDSEYLRKERRLSNISYTIRKKKDNLRDIEEEIKKLKAERHEESFHNFAKRRAYMYFRVYGKLINRHTWAPKICTMEQLHKVLKLRDKGEECCPICYETDENIFADGGFLVETDCGHFYCLDCLERLYKAHYSFETKSETQCGLCREPITMFQILNRKKKTLELSV